MGLVQHTRMVTLILLSRLGGEDFALNPDLIERAEATPDTVVTLVGGNKYVIRQSLDELIDLICLNRARVIATAERIGAHAQTAPEITTRASRFAARSREAGPSSVVPLHPLEG